MTKKDTFVRAKTGGKKGKIVPLGDRVLIRSLTEDGKEKKSAGGIIIPINSDEDKINRGTVLSVGEGRIDNNGKLVPMKDKVGAKVLFQWGDKVKIDGKEHYLVSETSILAIMK